MHEPGIATDRKREHNLKTPDIPTNEASRLQTLRSLGILDTPPEERFDRITRLARRMFDVPVALVTLVDESRQWFKSCDGLGTRETSREVSFCAHALLDDGVFVIPDAAEDVRFADNPLVTGTPNIRFYAGCPLTALNGDKLGTFCIIDSKARKLAHEDLLALQDLAAIVEDELAALQLALQDELTGIPNRRGFVQSARQSLAFCIRQGLPGSLVYLDIDNFKAINDTWGQPEGDLVLLTFADHLQKSFRESDSFARLGGDEFVVFLANVTKPQAELVFSRFSKALRKYNQEAVRGYDVAFSHGIVEFSNDKHASIETMLADGDALMYLLKKTKR